MDRRKELKLAYKLNPPPIGVYQIKNLISGKIFIGSSMNLPGIKNRYYFQLNANCHPDKELQADWNSHGADAFTFDILEILKSEEIVPEDYREALSALEDKWLHTLDPYNEKGYNKK